MNRENPCAMDPAARFEQLRQQLRDAPGGIHASRLERVVLNFEARFDPSASDDRLAHVLSRVGVFARGLATDLGSGDVTLDDAARLLSALADIGDAAFELWGAHGNSASE